jgi:phenylpyruvate tautomerase PptA (4-oxalocrotonate tautomerase family)
VPIIEVKAFASRFEDPAQAEKLIASLTDAFCAVAGEEVRAETWVLLSGYAPSHWGFGGQVRT